MSVIPVFLVKDFHASAKYYIEKLGFASEYQMDEPGADGNQHYFGSFAMGAGTSIMLGQRAGGSATSTDVEVMLYPEGGFDIDAHYETLKSRGVTIEQEIRTEYWGDRLFSVKDLDGYKITFGKTVEDVSIEEVAERLRLKNDASQ